MAGNKIKISDINLNLPQMQSAIAGWEVNIYANYITQEMVDGEVVENSHTEKIVGVRQPLKPEEVELKPEGQRAWSWYWLHVDSKYKPLKYEQEVTIKGETYRVMAVKDYSLDGFYEYHVVKGYQEG